MRQIRFTVPGKPETKSNQLKFGRNGHTYYPASKKRYERLVRDHAWAAMAEQDFNEPWDGYFTVVIEGWMPNHRVADLQNLFKSSMDALNGVVITDDSKIVAIENSFKAVSPHNPRLEVTVRDATVEEWTRWVYVEPNVDAEGFIWDLKYDGAEAHIIWKSKSMRKWRRWFGSTDIRLVYKELHRLGQNTTNYRGQVSSDRIVGIDE